MSKDYGVTECCDSKSMTCNLRASFLTWCIPLTIKRQTLRQSEGLNIRPEGSWPLTFKCDHPALNQTWHLCKGNPSKPSSGLVFKRRMWPFNSDLQNPAKTCPSVWTSKLSRKAIRAFSLRCDKDAAWLMKSSFQLLQKVYKSVPFCSARTRTVFASLRFQNKTICVQHSLNCRDRGS